MNNSPVAVQSNLFSLAPRNLQEAMEYANLIAQSSMVPAAFKGKAGDVLVAVQMGAELGLPPTQALQNIAVINGRPSLWGDAVLAVCKSSSLCEYVREYWDDEKKIAKCVAKRRGDDEEVVRTFSFEDANQAGLLNKQGPWRQYPQRMAQMRARSWAVRDAFPDLLRGIAVREEQIDAEQPKEKDVTLSKPEKSRSEALLEQLQQQTEPTPESGPSDEEKAQAALDTVLNAINHAQSLGDLETVGESAQQLPYAYREPARTAYKAKKTELEQEAA
ncbi:recombinase RecT [Zooshikella sp. RANM57]|uniref:recombinase RecT n=1 Tax=Zooshikella sp. RANM57 TaxID=3425863 RepID=UPI003D6F5571